MMRRFLDYVLVPSVGCVELRVIGAQFKNNRLVPDGNANRIFSGFFDNADDIVREAKRVRHVSVYCTFNPIHLDCMARAASNKLIFTKPGQGANDKLAVAVWWLYLDFDAKRTNDISATDEELARAIERRDLFLEENPAIAASSLAGCSGNGGFVLCRINDLPNTEDTKGYIKRALALYSTKYSDNVVSVDVKTCNASRVMCLPGTLKCKGTHRDDRPWRLVTLDRTPSYDLAASQV